MRFVRLVLPALILLGTGAAARGQRVTGPTDGAGLLDYCRAEEIVRQPPETRRLFRRTLLLQRPISLGLLFQVQIARKRS